MDKIPTNIISNRMAYLDSNAKPLAYGRLAIYERGSSTELALVYADARLTQRLENPVILDSSGRSPTLYNNGEPRATALYAEGSVYVKVEKYIGKDAHGNNLYSMVYDFETPPGVDISSYWNVNYVETYDDLKKVQNRMPTWVTGEGNAHLYVWDAQPSNGSGDGVTNIRSTFDPSGSWHWETKEVYADQCGINNDGTPYVVSSWATLQTISLGQKEIKIIIPAGTYLFNQAMGRMEFNDLEIMGGVKFIELQGQWEIGINKRVECLSDGLPITWVKLPMDRLYDVKYFASINAKKNLVDNDANIGIEENLTAKNLIARNNINALNDVNAGNDIIADKYVKAKNIISSNNINAKGDIYGSYISADNDVIADNDIFAVRDVVANNNLTIRGKSYGEHQLAIASDNSDTDMENLPVGSYATYVETYTNVERPFSSPMGLNIVVYIGSTAWRTSGLTSFEAVALSASDGGTTRYDVTYRHLIRRVI